MKSDALLFDLVMSALNGEDGKWPWLSKTKAGVISAAQLLAIILWAISDDESDAGKDQRIVAAWSARLVEATARRAAVLGVHGPTRDVIPRDPVTLLELRALPSNWDWVMAVDDADSFLKLVDAGFTCSGVLAYWRGEESPYTAPSDNALMARSQSPTASAQTAPGVGKSSEWRLFKPQRFQGYASPLYAYLKAAKDAASSLPTARDVLNEWRTKVPSEVAKVLVDGIDYYDASGNTKSADLAAIRKAIGRMTNR